MTRNVGTADQWLRIILGLVLLALIFIIDGPWRWIGLIGVVPLGTALLRWCPLYTLLGIDTCPREKGTA
jgi:Inner membrane protein YgaP-like, transmembrane domain